MSEEIIKLGLYMFKPEEDHSIPLIPVRNRVVFLNPNFSSLPIKLEENKPSSLGFFAKSKYNLDFSSPNLIFQLGEAWGYHKRSTLLGRMYFTDNQGQIYRDIDLKGIGYIGVLGNGDACVKLPGAKKGDEGDRWGLLDVQDAFNDHTKTEEFRQIGIRTCRTVAIIALEEYISGNELIPLKDGFRGTDFYPAVQVRAYPTKARITELYEQPGKVLPKLFYKDALNIVSAELGKQATVSPEEYIRWFAETLGQNVGAIHSNGYTHNYLTAHNITLDCRIVDFDSVKFSTQSSERQEDCFEAVSSVINLIFAITDITRDGDRTKYPSIEQEAEELFCKGYQRALKEDVLTSLAV